MLLQIITHLELLKLMQICRLPEIMAC